MTPDWDAIDALLMLMAIAFYFWLASFLADALDAKAERDEQMRRK